MIRLANDTEKEFSSPQMWQDYVKGFIACSKPPPSLIFVTHREPGASQPNATGGRR